MSIREQIARWLQKNTDFACNLEWDDFDEDAQEGFRDKADQILAIEGLEQRAENQELPENPFSVRSFDSMRGWERGIEDMLKGDNSGYWVKVKRR